MVNRRCRYRRGRGRGSALIRRSLLAAIMASPLSDLVRIIRDAEPAAQGPSCTPKLGLMMTYRPQKRLVEATCRRSEEPGLDESAA